MNRVIVLVVACLLAGCSAPQLPPGNPDSFFAQRMILHTNQAVEAAKLVEGRTGTPALKTIAQRIQAQPAAEIAQLTGLVREWGEVPHVSDASLPGAIKASDLDKLREVKDQKFDTGWMDLMIVHHLGAIKMAETELRQGTKAEAKALAQKVIDVRQPELDVLQGMSGG
ncbi:DUF305 domain-containing protein [Actinocrispum sp. NPDC049592]|uniref:DUF305 domain-containing protein n=1 Tax=Actinocrispum sp. NPDC049592 TaxID=3154835 RepID=UPI00342ECDB2